ncbi:MAG: class I SAM-dependent methyltransferase, partial [Lachnospiraceae bacterium]|nr:class I SAM-dependent methyltransferase [Lachnospiraceae bacterium]
IKDDAHLSLLLSLADCGRNGKILDIGTGTGYLAFPLAEKFPAANVCGIDIAETMMKKNNTIVREKNIPNLTFEAFDGFTYPFSDESFDLIVTRYAFHHFPNAVSAVLQMHRLLAKGGKVLISDPMRNERDDNRIIDRFMSVKKDGHMQFYSAKELEDLFIGNGFTKKQQVITQMKFPLAQKAEYIELYNGIARTDRMLYDIAVKDDIVWIGHIDVGNTVFVRQ